MEVTEDTYLIYHKTRRRQKYIDECSYKKRDFSYDSLDTEEMLGEDIFADASIDVEKQVEDMTINVYTHVMDEFKRKEAAKFSLFPTF